MAGSLTMHPCAISAQVRRGVRGALYLTVDPSKLLLTWFRAKELFDQFQLSVYQ